MKILPLRGLSNSWPALDPKRLSAADLRFFESLPPEYRDLLLTHNGGFLPEFEYSFKTGVPYRMHKIDKPSREDCLAELFGIATAGAASPHPKDLIRTCADYEAEEFLPANVIAIGRCIQSSLVCISTRGPDAGRIYYWDWYWRYPWCRWFFDERIERVTSRYENAPAILNDPTHPQHLRLGDELNYATLVPLADSISSWLNSCYRVGPASQA
jgi:hypothetical protein